MLVAKFRVTNYKSFRDSGYLRLGAGFNVIVGRNNVGKTALVEALSLRSADKPHRSPETVPNPSAAPDPFSRVEVSFELSKEELVGLMRSSAPTFYVPLWGVISPPAFSDVQHHVQDFFSAISERNVIEAEFSSGGVNSAQLISYGERIEMNSNIYALQFEIVPSGEEFRLSSEQLFNISGQRSFMVQASAALVNRVYHFKAERLNVGEVPAVRGAGGEGRGRRNRTPARAVIGADPGATFVREIAHPGGAPAPVLAASVHHAGRGPDEGMVETRWERKGEPGHAPIRHERARAHGPKLQGPGGRGHRRALEPRGAGAAAPRLR